MKITIPFPVLIGCVIAWVFHGLPLDPLWILSFAVCGSIEIFIGRGKKDESNT